MFRPEKPWFTEAARKEYPFLAHYSFSAVGKMHYIDEGSGEVILMIHGNPSWSFTYRKLITGLSKNYRCIAIDLLGFGFSDKPYEWTYEPADHAQIIKDFIHRLRLQNITLVVNDWGGPIGLSYAVKYPENVKRLILFNTWMWSVKGNKYYERFSGFMGSSLGRFLIRRWNFFGKSVVSMAIGNKKNFIRRVRKIYYKHLEKPEDRKGCWVFPAEIIKSSDWLSELWDAQDSIKEKPTLIIWGMKDIAFRRDILKVWTDLFTDKVVVELQDTGHFPQEEHGEECAKYIKVFMER